MNQTSRYRPVGGETICLVLLVELFSGIAPGNRNIRKICADVRHNSNNRKRLNSYTGPIATRRRVSASWLKIQPPSSLSSFGLDCVCCYRSGDMLLSVNGRSTDGATHDAVAQLLMERRTDLVELKVVSWPGSPLWVTAAAIGICLGLAVVNSGVNHAQFGHDDAASFTVNWTTWGRAHGFFTWLRPSASLQACALMYLASYITVLCIFLSVLLANLFLLLVVWSSFYKL